MSVKYFLENKCKICTGNLEHLFEKKQFTYKKCATCGLVCIDPQPTDEELNAIYEYGYFNDWGNESDYKACKIKNFEYILNNLPIFLKPKSKVLDVGAATGIFVELLEQQGYDAYGVELSKDGYAECIKKVSSEKIVNSFFETADFSEHLETSKFSCIFMCDFLEHVRDPNVVLQKAASLLENGGYITLHVPNVKSIFQKILGKRWEFYTTDHLFYYSRETLKMLLEKNGFIVKRFETGVKYITIDYMLHILSSRLSGGPLSLLCPILKLFPASLKKWPIKLYYGELTCYAELKQ